MLKKVQCEVVPISFVADSMQTSLSILSPADSGLQTSKSWNFDSGLATLDFFSNAHPENHTDLLSLSQ